MSDAIRNVQKYSQGESLQNVQGNGDFGPSIQFDTKGVDFGPWLRRFIAQIRRNWFVPYAAMSLHGHVVLRFNVHKDGTHHRSAGAAAVERSTPSPSRRSTRSSCRTPPCRSRSSIPDENARVHRHLLLQRNAARRRVTVSADRTQQIGLFLVLTVLAIYAVARAWSG